MLYPTVCLVAVVATILNVEPDRTAVALMWITPAPMVFEWVLEQMGHITYSPRRQVSVSLGAGIGGGIALGLHIQQPFTPPAVWPILVAAAVCLISSVRGHKSRQSSGHDWLDRHEQAEARRSRQLDAVSDDWGVGDPPVTAGDGGHSSSLARLDRQMQPDGKLPA